jgi:hypothetical protein
LNKIGSLIFLAATLILLIVVFFVRLDYIVALVMVGLATTTGIGCVWCAAEHREDIEVEKARSLAAIALMTEDLEKHRLVSRFTDAQIRYMMSQAGPIVDVRGDKPITIYRLLTGEVCSEATEHFLAYKDFIALRPERYYAQDEKWSNGDYKRESAKAIIQHCVLKKYAAGPENGRKLWIGNGRSLFAWEVGQGTKNLNDEK